MATAPEIRPDGGLLATCKRSAFPSATSSGPVILSWDVHDGDGPDRLWMRWEEIGGPPVAKPEPTSFRSRMIDRALVTELGGNAGIEYRPGGVVFTVEAPLLNAAVDRYEP